MNAMVADDEDEEEEELDELFVSSSGGRSPSSLPTVVVIPSRSGDAVFGRGRRRLLLLLPLVLVLLLLLLLPAVLRSSCAATISPCQMHVVCEVLCVVRAVEWEIRGQVSQDKYRVEIRACPELIGMVAVVVDVVGGLV